MGDMRTSREGWTIYSADQASAWGIFTNTRNEAISEFCKIVDRACYEAATLEAKAGRVFYSRRALTSFERTAWRKYQRKGFMAVHAFMQVSDYRVEDDQ